MKKVKVEEAVGMVLAHDLTEIIPLERKGVIFRRGHRIREEDVEVLLRTGNHHIWVLEPEKGKVHEEEAALRVSRALVGDFLDVDEPKEGRVWVRAKKEGLFRVDKVALREVNAFPSFVVASLHDGSTVKEGQVVAAVKTIPLFVEQEELERCESLFSKRKALWLKPFRPLEVGVIVTGTEVYEGRVKDGFDLVLKPKLEEMGVRVKAKVVVPDDPLEIASSINCLRVEGVQAILTTGGLGVDAGDVTLEGVKLAGAKVVVYGAPVFPGSMFLYAVLEGLPIFGLPACVYYNKRTVFDLLFPWVLAGEEITWELVRGLGHGGICLGCPECRYPLCPFGKG